jgi:hypothetical protein
MKSSLEQFAEKVVNTALNTKPETKEGDVGAIDIAALTQLIEVVAQVVMEVMNNCPAKSTLALSVKKPNFMQRVRFRNAVKGAVDSCGNFKLRALSGKLAEVSIAEGAKLTDDEIAKIVDESENLDNWLI